MNDTNQDAATAAVQGLTPVITPTKLQMTLLAVISAVFGSIGNLSTQVTNIGAANTDASKLTSGLLAPVRLPPFAGDLTCTVSGTSLSCTAGTVLGGLKPWRIAAAALTVTATNTLSALPQTYDGRLCKLFANGVTYTDKDANIPFTVSGKTIAWSAANSGYALPVGAAVTSECTY